jgi:hypothetical protein
MLSKECAHDIVLRLAGLEKFPMVEAAQDELVKAMMQAPSEAIAAQFVSDWIREGRKCPKPGDLWKTFRPPPMRNSPPVNTGCSICGGTGWRIVERQGFSAATRCLCHSRW